MSDTACIGIPGDFNAELRSHHATNETLQHAAHQLKLEVIKRVDPDAFTGQAGSGEDSGIFRRILGVAREPPQKLRRNGQGDRVRPPPRPALPRYLRRISVRFPPVRRNVLHIADADSAENNSGSKNIVVYPVAFAVPNGKGDAPKLSGAIAEIRAFVPVHFCRPNSGDKEVVTQEFFCNVELNPAFEWTTMETGFPVVALGRQVRYAPLNLPTDRSYLAKVFQPQSSSTEKNPYPFVLAFVQAAADWRKKKLDDCVLE